MDFKVAATLFNSGGGGGGGFFFGRGQQEQPRDEQEAEPEAGDLGTDAVRWSSRDRSGLHIGHPSQIRLSLPPAATLEEPVAPSDEELAALEAEILGKLRVLAFGVGRLEQAYARRLHAEVGETRVS